MTNALGYAASLAGGLTEGFSSGTMEHMFQAGLAAQNAILGAQIAATGATASEVTLEGRHGFYRSFSGSLEKIHRATADLGKSFSILEIRRKPYPAHGFNQESIALVQDLMVRYKPDPLKIERVVERASLKKKGYAGVDACPPYKNVFQALLSIQFCLAAALLGRPVDSYQFFFEHYDDPEVADLAKKIEIVGEEGREILRIELHYKDGTQQHIEKDASEILIPTWENTEAKFRKMAAGALSEGRISEIIHLMHKLETVENIRQFSDKLRR